MLSSPTSRPGRSSEKESPTIRRLMAEAEAARDAGDLRGALSLYREGLDLAPMSRPLRDAFAETLMMIAEKKKRRVAPGSSAVLAVDPPPAASVLNDLLEEQPVRPGPRRSAPPRRDGSSDSRQIRRPKQSIPEPKRPAAKVVDTKHAPRERMSRRRLWTLAALYTGICLMLLGVAQGLISSAIDQVPLPEVPSVVEVPPALVEILNAASEDLSKGETEKAVERLEAARTEYPAHSELVEAALARSLRAQGNRLLGRMEYAKAAETFERATRVDPLNADNWIELGRTYREHGRHQQSRSDSQADALLTKARNAYETALDLRRNDAEALIGLAQTAAFQNDRSRAVSLYERVIASAPDSREAGLARRNLQQLTGRN